MSDITIDQNDRLIQYTAAGGETSLDYDFPIFAATDLGVDKVDTSGNISTLTYGTDYTVSGVGAAGGGSIALTTAAVAGEVYALYGDSPESRSTNFATSGSFTSSNINQQLNQLLMMIQQVARDAARAVRIGITDTQASADLELPASSGAQQVLIRDTDGTFKLSTGSPFSAAWLNDINELAYNLLGDGTNAPTTKADAMANLFSGGAKIHPTSDVNALLLTGYSKTGGAHNVLGIQRAPGATQIVTVGQNSNPIMVIETDDDTLTPLLVRGNSSTQSGDLLYVYRNGSVPIFSIRANGDFDFTNPNSTGYNTYTNISNGTAITFFNQDYLNGPQIARYEVGGTFSIKTSLTTHGDFGVTNMIFAASGTTCDADLVINTGSRLNYMDSQTTVGAAGSASALPSAPQGYANIQINGVERVIPYYAAA